MSFSVIFEKSLHKDVKQRGGFAPRRTGLATLQDTVPGKPSPQENNHFCSKEKKKFNCENSGKKITLKPSASFPLIDSECFPNPPARAYPSHRPGAPAALQRGVLHPEETSDPDFWGQSDGRQGAA